MEKNGLEMHSQGHRFIFKKYEGSIPSHTLPSPARLLVTNSRKC